MCVAKEADVPQVLLHIMAYQAEAVIKYVSMSVQIVRETICSDKI